MGLLEAVRRFDPDRASFRTYARHWVLGLLRNEIAMARSVLSLPRQLAGADVMLDLRAEELERTLRRPPTTAELAERLRVSPRSLQHVIEARVPVVRLGPGEYDGQPDVEAPDDSPGALEGILDKETAEIIEEALAALPDQQRMILRAYFGLGRTQEMNLEEIGQTMGRTRERVRQLRNQALNALRTGPYAEKLAEIWGKQREEGS